MKSELFSGYEPILDGEGVKLEFTVHSNPKIRHALLIRIFMTAISRIFVRILWANENRLFIGHKMKFRKPNIVLGLMNG